MEIYAKPITILSVILIYKKYNKFIIVIPAYFDNNTNVRTFPTLQCTTSFT